MPNTCNNHIPSKSLIDDAISRCLYNTVFKADAPSGGYGVFSLNVTQAKTYKINTVEDLFENSLSDSLKRLNIDNLKNFNFNNIDLNELKRSVKIELKRFDMDHERITGTVPDKQAKEALRPLYTFYHQIKSEILKINNETNTLKTPKEPTNNENPLSIEEQIEILNKSKEECRRQLQEYQTEFVREHGRRIRYHRDILPVESIYARYKEVKEGLIKLGVGSSSRDEDVEI